MSVKCLELKNKTKNIVNQTSLLTQCLLKYIMTHSLSDINILGFLGIFCSDNIQLLHTRLLVEGGRTQL